MDAAFSVVRARTIRCVVLGFLLVSLAEAAVTVQLFRFSAGRYVRFAVADTASDLAGVSSPVEGLPVYVADEDTLYCYAGGSWASCNAGGAGGAPTGAEYVVGALHVGLSAERVGTDTAEIDWDFGTAGQAKLNLIDNSIEVSRLKTSDTPGDGECIVYEATGDEVAFEACGGGASDHGALTGLTDDDHTIYALLAGRSGGQVINGGNSSTDDLSLRANSVAGYPRLELEQIAASDYRAKFCAGPSAGGAPCFVLQDDGSSYTLSVNIDTFAVNSSSNTPSALFDTVSNHLALDGRIGLGVDVADTATQSCADVDSDRWYGDKDCDGTKDAGEEYFDDVGGGSGTSVALDLGDDGSNESSAITELATTNDTYGVVTEPSADKALIDFAKVPPYGEYDPDRPPSSVYLSDEFTGGASLTYSWGNQDSATIAEQRDGLLLDGVNTAEYHAYGIDQTAHTMPTNSDQTFCVSMRIAIDGSGTDGCGIGVLDGGTMASPTAQSMIAWSQVSTDSIYVFDDADFVPVGATTVTSKALTYDGAVSGPWYWRISYVDSTRVASFGWSRDGKLFEQFGATTTLGADPVTWFVVARESAQCWVDYVRLFDSADADCGE